VTSIDLRTLSSSDTTSIEMFGSWEGEHYIVGAKLGKLRCMVRFTPQKLDPLEFPDVHWEAQEARIRSAFVKPEKYLNKGWVRAV